MWGSNTHLLVTGILNFLFTELLTRVCTITFDLTGIFLVTE